MNQQQLLISIDDTDNLDSPGSGTLAERLAAAISQAGLARCGEISRHQLFVDDAIPYTSHNSAMCFTADNRLGSIGAIITFSQDFLQREAAVGSDPGLCVVADDSSLKREPLIAFGRSAKQRILTKQDAYHLAGEMYLHLSEHGGSGGGIIGALAAIGLRLTGNDGRIRGWQRLGGAGSVTTAGDLCRHPAVDAVFCENGERLDDHIQVVFAEDEVKTVLLHGLKVVPVRRADHLPSSAWTTLNRRQMKRY
jgi:hypothetical protein